MFEQNLWIIKLFLQILGAGFGVCAALLSFLSIAQNEKHEITKKWFRRKWNGIKQSKWQDLAERAIKSLILTKTNLKKMLVIPKNFWMMLFIMYIFFFFNAGVSIWFGWLYLGASLLLCFVFLYSVTRTKSDFLKNKILLFSTATITIVTPLIWFAIALNRDPVISVVSMIGVLPSSFLLFVFPVLFLEEHLFTTEMNTSDVVLIGMTLCFSSFITFLSFLIGITIIPNSYVPQTFQMVVSNIIFDGLTVFFTIRLLEWALKKSSLMRIPIAISVDFLVAAILACFSLYTGLFLSENHLSWYQVFLVLVGKSPRNAGYELGPYFWAMHTTFIPTIFYVFVIFIAWMGKVILVPVEWFFEKGQEHKNPLLLTAALCMLFVAIFSISAMAVTEFLEHLEKQKKTTEILQARYNPSPDRVKTIE